MQNILYPSIKLEDFKKKFWKDSCMSYDTKFGEFKPWWTDGFLKSQDYLQPIWSHFTISFRYFLKRGINVCQEFYMIFYRVFFSSKNIFIKSQFFIVWWEAMLMVTNSSSSPVNTLGLSLVPRILTQITPDSEFLTCVAPRLFWWQHFICVAQSSVISQSGRW